MRVEKDEGGESQRKKSKPFLAREIGSLSHSRGWQRCSRETLTAERERSTSLEKVETIAKAVATWIDLILQT